MPVSMTGTIEEVRNYRDQVSKQWDDALERPKSDVETRTVDLTRGCRFGSNREDPAPSRHSRSCLNSGKWPLATVPAGKCQQPTLEPRQRIPHATLSVV